ncbi:prolipoprotein diacylglyceryl transferase [Lachnospiraceae bacterium ZAX-1]
MLPFISVFGREISMYAICIIVGIVAGICVAFWRTEIYGYKKEDVLFASIYGVFFAIVGGKILYLFTILPFIMKNFQLIISSIHNIQILMVGGFVFYGGLLGAFVGIFIYTKQYKLDTGKMIEIMAPSFPLIHAFGRVGCFCAGCCYGKPFHDPIGLYFTKSQIAPHDVSLFPIQLLEALCNLLLFAIMAILFRKKETKGQAIAVYLCSYAILRFGLEFMRYDMERGFLLGFSTSQWISVLVLLAFAFRCHKRFFETC